MADDGANKNSNHDPDAVNLFTHSSTGFPGAWTEEEISTLLDTWQEVVEKSRATTRRFDVAQRIIKSYRRKGNEKVTIDVIRKQVSTLRAEYTAYQLLAKIGIKTVRAPCVDQLELILDKIPSSRRRLYSGTRDRKRTDSEATEQAVFEETDRSRNGSRSSANGQMVPAIETVNQKPRIRYQRVNLQRLFRTMLDQQQIMMERLEKIFQAFETSNTKMVDLLDTLISMQKDSDQNLYYPESLVKDFDKL